MTLYTHLVALWCFGAVSHSSQVWVYGTRPRIWPTLVAAFGLAVSHLIDPTGWRLVAFVTWVAWLGVHILWSAYWTDTRNAESFNTPIDGGNR